MDAAAERPGLRLRGSAYRGARGSRHLCRLDRRDGAEPEDAGCRLGLDGAGDDPLRPLRKRQKLPLTKTVKVKLKAALGVEDIEYRSVVVAFEDGQPFSEEMVATAVKLASTRRRGIHVHSMIEVPSHLPLNAEMKREESDAQSKIEQAKLIGGMRVSGHVERVRPGQAGYSISKEAELIKAVAVVVGLRRRNGRPVYGKTLQTVLGERPCRVIVVSEGGGRAPAAAFTTCWSGAEAAPSLLESRRWLRPRASTTAPCAPFRSCSSRSGWSSSWSRCAPGVARSRWAC